VIEKYCVAIQKGTSKKNSEKGTTSPSNTPNPTKENENHNEIEKLINEVVEPKYKKQKIQHTASAIIDSDLEPNHVNKIENDSQAVDIRPICKYGEDCYRKNPEHLRDFRHPNKNASIATPKSIINRSNSKINTHTKTTIIEDDDNHDAYENNEDSDIEDNILNNEQEKENHHINDNHLTAKDLVPTLKVIPTQVATIIVNATDDGDDTEEEDPENDVTAKYPSVTSLKNNQSQKENKEQKKTK